MPSANYGPPIDSDSDDSSYDGFYFGDDFIKKKENRPQLPVVNNHDQLLYDAVVDGDLAYLKELISELNWNVNSRVKNGFTLLLLACSGGLYNIVKYLVEELQADVNLSVDSYSPLMTATDCRKGDALLVEKMVTLLLAHGAVLNISDKYGTTPFMTACKKGYANVVRLMIKDVSFDAMDNQSCTPIFHAIENNRVEIVKILVEAGVNATISNRKGYTPVQVAEFHGFYDLLQYLPRDQNIGYCVPSNYLSYNCLRDHIPRIFLKSECPEYFQEISNIMITLDMRNYLEYFAKGKVSLAEFLTMNDEKLESLGVDFPFYRSKIKKGILDFHLHQWSKESIARVSRKSMENFYAILLITANHLRHLIIIQSSLKFIVQNVGELGECTPTQLQNFRQNLLAYRTTVRDLTRTTKYLASFSPERNPLYINYDEIVAERKRKKVCNFFKYTTIVLGTSVFICLTVKRWL